MAFQAEKEGKTNAPNSKTNGASTDHDFNSQSARRLLARLSPEELEHYAAGLAVSELEALKQAKLVKVQLNKLQRSYENTNHLEARRLLAKFAQNLDNQITILSNCEISGKVTQKDYFGAVLSAGPDFYRKTGNLLDTLTFSNTVAVLTSLNSSPALGGFARRAEISRSLTNYLVTPIQSLPAASDVLANIKGLNTESHWSLFRPPIIGRPIPKPTTNPTTTSSPTLPRAMGRGAGIIGVGLLMSDLAFQNEDFRHWLGDKLPEWANDYVQRVPLPKFRLPSQVFDDKKQPKEPRVGVIITATDSYEDGREKLHEFLTGKKYNSLFAKNPTVSRREKEIISSSVNNEPSPSNPTKIGGLTEEDLKEIGLKPGPFVRVGTVKLQSFKKQATHTSAVILPSGEVVIVHAKSELDGATLNKAIAKYKPGASLFIEPADSSYFVMVIPSDSSRDEQIGLLHILLSIDDSNRHAPGALATQFRLHVTPDHATVQRITGLEKKESYKSDAHSNRVQGKMAQWLLANGLRMRPTEIRYSDLTQPDGKYKFPPSTAKRFLHALERVAVRVPNGGNTKPVPVYSLSALEAVIQPRVNLDANLAAIPEGYLSLWSVAGYINKSLRSRRLPEITPATLCSSFPKFEDAQMVKPTISITSNPTPSEIFLSKELQNKIYNAFGIGVNPRSYPKFVSLLELKRRNGLIGINTSSFIRGVVSELTARMPDNVVVKAFHNNLGWCFQHAYDSDFQSAFKKLLRIKKEEAEQRRIEAVKRGRRLQAEQNRKK